SSSALTAMTTLAVSWSFAVAESRFVAWQIFRAPVHGGQHIYVLTITVNGKVVEQSYFAWRSDACDARDAAMELYRG
ncbi:hypothetical protein NEH40_21970, partial [Xanthomonas hortorum pv. pelargonii]